MKLMIILKDKLINMQKKQWENCKIFREVLLTNKQKYLLDKKK